MLFLLLFSTVTFAQLEPVTDASFGTFTPLFQYQGNLFVNQIYDNPDTQGEDFRYFKINIATNAVTQLNVSESAAPYFVNGWWAGQSVFNPQYYGSDVYFHIAVGSQMIVKIDTQNNLIDLVDPIAQGQGVQQFHDRLYYGWDTYKGYIDLLTGSIIPIENPLVRYDTSSSFVAGNDLFMQYVNGEGNKHFSKFNEYYAFEPENDLYIAPEYNFYGFYPKYKPIFVNDRLIYTGNDGNEVNIISFAIEDLESNLNILDITEDSFQDYLILNDGVIFYIVHYNIQTGIYSYKWYKTDGINNAVEINNYMPIPEAEIGSSGFNPNWFFQTYSDWNSFYINSQGNSFVKAGNTVYFTTLEHVNGYYKVKLYKMTSINSAPELIHTFTDMESNWAIRYATEWQDELVFYNGEENVIYSYNGTELYIDPQLNTFNASGRSMQQDNVVVTGIFADANYILVNTEDDGLFKIEEEALSTTEQELIPVKIYPNPVSETLNFSKSLKDITIYDLTGRTIKSFTGNQDKIDVSTLSNGNYFLKGETLIGNFITKQFIKN